MFGAAVVIGITTTVDLSMTRKTPKTLLGMCSRTSMFLWHVRVRGRGRVRVRVRARSLTHSSRCFYGMFASMELPFVLSTLPDFTQILVVVACILFRNFLN